MSPRIIHTAIFVVCAGLIGFALFLQHGQGLEPCPLCILQRYAFIVTGLIALFAALHDPKGGSRWFYGILLIIASGTGAGLATRHVYLEHYPPNLYDCGADLGYMIESFPLSEALPMIFRGTGDCTKVLWRFLGLSIAEWSLIWFLVILVAAIAALAMRRRRSHPFAPR